MTPPKPYPAYKDSGIPWLGEIPVHWKAKPLKRVFRLINGSTPNSSTPEFWDGNIHWATPEDLGQLTTDTISETNRQITRSGYQSCGTTLAPTGSLVLSTRAPIGHLAITGVAMCTNQGCRLLVFRSEKDRRFFYYQLLVARPELRSWGQGSTFQELGKSKLEVVLLIDPPAAEQRAISAFLDRETIKIEGLIAKKERMIALLKEKRAALISHAITKGLDGDAPRKDSGVEWLGKIPACWEVMRLKFNCRKIGSGTTPKGGAETYLDTGVLFLRSQNVHFDGLRLEEVAYISDDVDSEMANTRVVANDILLNITGASLGRCAIVPGDIGAANVNQHVCIIRTKSERLEPHFLKFSLAAHSVQAQIFAGEEGVSREGLNFVEIGDFVLTSPPVIEQRAIAAYLDRETARMDATIGKTQAHIGLLRERRAALISAAVTGKIDVREADWA
jgi:type I restriction enzyme S subunit